MVNPECCYAHQIRSLSNICLATHTQKSQRAFIIIESIREYRMVGFMQLTWMIVYGVLIVFEQ